MAEKRKAPQGRNPNLVGEPLKRPKRQEKRDYELPETQSGFSMADLFGDIEL